MSRMDRDKFMARIETELLAVEAGIDWEDLWSALLHGRTLVELFQIDPFAVLKCDGADHWRLRLSNGTSVTGPSLLGVYDNAFADYRPLTMTLATDEEAAR